MSMSSQDQNTTDGILKVSEVNSPCYVYQACLPNVVGLFIVRTDNFMGLFFFVFFFLWRSELQHLHKAK